MNMDIVLKKCCPRDCLSTFPEELRVRTMAQIAKWTTKEKSIFLMGKLAASLALGEIPDHSKTGSASKIAYYTFDKNHVICRTAFQVVYDISDVHLRGIKRQLAMAEIDLQKLDENQSKRARMELSRMEVDPEAELKIVRKAIKNKCCAEDCMSKIPEALLSKTKADLILMPAREKYMFLVGKISSCLSVVGTVHDTPTSGTAIYNYDKDYPLCKPAFQLIYGVQEHVLRRIRDRIFDNLIEYETRSVIDSVEEPLDEKAPSLQQEVEGVIDAINRGCCQKHCMQKIPAEMLAQIRLQMKQMSSTDRHAFLLGKISSSISIVRLSIVPTNETQARATYSFDRDHPLCSTAFNIVYAGCKDQFQRLRNHLLTEGISLAAHGLTGKPSNSKGKKTNRKSKAGDVDIGEMHEEEYQSESYPIEARSGAIEISEALRPFLQ